jgi:hypothetical protein
VFPVFTMFGLAALRCPSSLPAGLDAELMDAGVGWDAVRVPEYLGDRVLARLDRQCGAVIRDPYAALLYFLILPGAADEWTFPDEARVRILGSSSAVLVPPLHLDHSPGPHWVRRVVNGRVLTRSRRLHAAVQAVIADAFGPRTGTAS